MKEMRYKISDLLYNDVYYIIIEDISIEIMDELLFLFKDFNILSNVYSEVLK